MQATLKLYQALLAGPVLGLLVVIFLLTRRRVLAWVRTASWVGFLGWWLIAILPWVVVTLAGRILFFGTTWYARVLIHVLDFVIPFAFFAPLLFALGATVVWVTSRLKARASGVSPRGA
jgi:hypothetical protein